MSKWSVKEAIACAEELLRNTDWSTEPDDAVLGRAILDLRERAEKAEQRADEHYKTILVLNEQEMSAARENASLDTTCRELTKRLAASEQRCAALEAALRGVEFHEAGLLRGQARQYMEAGLSGDTSALREKLLQMGGLVWAMAAPDAKVDANTIKSAAESVMEGR